MNQPQTYSTWETSEWLKSPDLIIVGAGITGASTALFYKHKYPNHDVLILERGPMPLGASTRNAGFACIGSISEHLSDMKSAGEDVVLNRITRRWNGLNKLRSVMGDGEIGYNSVGGHEIFADRKIFEMCREQIPVLNRQLQERLGIGKVYRETKFEGYPAIFNRVEGSINSGQLMRNLHRRLSDAGVRVWWNSEVESIDQSTLKLADGPILSASKIVLATNGFSKHLTDVSIEPARGYVMVTEPIEDLKWCGTFHFNEGYIYFRDLDNRLLIGGARNVAKGEESTGQFGVNQKIKSHLTQFASDVLKLPSGWKIEREWSGIMGMTPDKEPIIRQVEPNVWVVAGLSGMGIAIGMEVGGEVVEQIGDYR